MKAVAAELGISVKRLAKICDHFKIPYPQTSRHGHKPSAARSPPPLPPTPISGRAQITITSPAARLDPKTQPVEQARIRRPRGLDTPYHPELKRWLRDYLQRQPSTLESKEGSEASDIPAEVLRRFKIVNRIFLAAHTKGLMPTMAEKRWCSQVLLQSRPTMSASKRSGAVASTSL